MDRLNAGIDIHAADCRWRVGKQEDIQRSQRRCLSVASDQFNAGTLTSRWFPPLVPAAGL